MLSPKHISTVVAFASSGLYVPFTDAKGLLEGCGDDLADSRDIHRQSNGSSKLLMPILTPLALPLYSC